MFDTLVELIVLLSGLTSIIILIVAVSAAWFLIGRAVTNYFKGDRQ